MWPPMEASFSTRTTSWPPSAMSSAAWMPAMPPPITRARLVTGMRMVSQRLVVLDLLDDRADDVDGLGGGLVAVLVDPGAVLADVGHLAQEGVEAGLRRRRGGRSSRACAASRRRRRRRSRSLLRDGLLDQRAGRGRSTCTCSRRRTTTPGCSREGLGDRGAVDGAGDVLAAVTDEDADAAHEATLSVASAAPAVAAPAFSRRRPWRPCAASRSAAAAAALSASRGEVREERLACRRSGARSRGSPWAGPGRGRRAG